MTDLVPAPETKIDIRQGGTYNLDEIRRKGEEHLLMLAVYRDKALYSQLALADLHCKALRTYDEAQGVTSHILAAEGRTERHQEYLEGFAKRLSADLEMELRAINRSAAAS